MTNLILQNTYIDGALHVILIGERKHRAINIYLKEREW